MKKKKIIKVGDTVDYHSVIGEKATSIGHVVVAIYPDPNNFGCDTATITGKIGVVSVDSLSHSLAKTSKICSKTSTVGDLKKILSCLPDEAELYLGPDLMPLEGVTLDLANKRLFLYSPSFPTNRKDI